MRCQQFVSKAPSCTCISVHHPQPGPDQIRSSRPKEVVSSGTGMTCRTCPTLSIRRQERVVSSGLPGWCWPTPWRARSLQLLHPADDYDCVQVGLLACMLAHGGSYLWTYKHACLCIIRVSPIYLINIAVTWKTLKSYCFVLFGCMMSAAPSSVKAPPSLALYLGPCTCHHFR